MGINSMRGLCAAAGVFAALALAACNKTAADPAETPIGETATPAQTATPAATADPFATAITYACEGGGTIDIAFAYGGATPLALVRVDGGAMAQLNAETERQDTLAYTDGAQTITVEGDGVVWKKGSETKTCRAVSKSLPAPRADGVLKTFTIDDKNPAIALKIGERFAVALVGAPTAGYVWGAEDPPALVKVTDGPGGPTSTSQLLPGFAGGSHWEVLIIEAIAAGEGEVGLVQKRPWEDKAEPDADRYTVKVKVASN